MRVLILNLILLGVAFSSKGQSSDYYKLTVISIDDTAALIFEGDLKFKEQVRLIYFNDEENTTRVRNKITRSQKPLWMIIKGAKESVKITSDYIDQINKIIGPAVKITSDTLNNKELEIVELFFKLHPNGY